LIAAAIIRLTSPETASVSTIERPMCYITNMAKTRPLIERTYRVVPLKDGTFAEDGTFVVEIAVTGTWPTKTARAFATEAEAEAWIARNKLK
jgi:hypothetical protein